MNNAPLDSIGAKAAPLPQGSPSAEDVLRLLYLSSADGSTDPLASLDLTSLSPKEYKKLSDKLAEHSDKISDADRKAMEQHHHEAVRALLVRLREEIAANAALQAQAAARLDDAVSHEVAQKPAPHAAATEVLPFAEPGVTAVSAAAPAEPSRLAAIRQELLALVSDPRSPRQDKAQALLGTSAPQLRYKGGFPAQGRSGEAHQQPLLQFAPSSWRSALQALGVQNLAEFLVRAHSAMGRRLLAEALGTVQPALLLAVLRAELLDLPTERGKPSPHLKDVLFFSRLGLRSVDDLARLGRALETSPNRLELAGKLVSLLQRADANYVGRQKLTRHELRAWAVAAERRGSDVTSCDSDATGFGSGVTCSGPDAADDGPHKSTDVHSAGEAVLAWYLRQRLSDDEAAWDNFVANALALLAQTGSSEVQARLLRELAAESSAAARSFWHDLLARLEDERADFDLRRLENLVGELQQGASEADSEWSLMRDLAVRMRHDAERSDNLICFWLQPPASLSSVAPQPAYVCLDPQSGAILPHVRG